MAVDFQGQLIQPIPDIGQPLGTLDHAIKMVPVDDPQLQARRRGVHGFMEHLHTAKSMSNKMTCKLVVIYVPGNHDEFARHFVGHAFGGVEVVHESTHTTAQGLKLWVVHGDHFDGVIQCAKWLAYVGDWLYELTLKINRHLNSFRARVGLHYWSLSAYLKLKVKKAVNFISDFEVAVAHEAQRRGFDGVVCGHIHHAEIRDVNGILYCNDGDWVESRTALVEHLDGRLEIIHWGAQAVVLNRAPTAQAVAA